MEVRRNELLQIEAVVGTRNMEKIDAFRMLGGIEDAIKNGSDQQNSKRVKEADQRHQQDGREKMQPVRAAVVQ
jgi:hypothetical protein